MTAQPKTLARPRTKPKEDAQHWLLSAIRLWGLALLTLHVAAFALPEESTWSLWPYIFLPGWLGWGLALLAGALIIPTVNQTALTGLHRLWGYVSRVTYHVSCIMYHVLRITYHVSRITFRASRFLPINIAPKHIGFALFALLFGLLFWLARLRHLKWGDSYLLSVALSYPDLDLRVIYNWQAPFTVFLHQRLWQFVADPLLGWPVESVYATTSIICGIIFVYVLLIFMTRLGRNTTEAIFLTGLVLTTGSMQLFFGYVENYTVVSLMLLVTLFLAWQALMGEIKPVWPVLGLSLANAFHPSTVFLWPGMWLLGWLCWRRKRVSAISVLLQTMLPPLIIGSSVLALMESGGHGLAAFMGVDRPGGGDGIWFVPIFETQTEWQHYTMFSVAHILDWTNLHLLISPFGLPLIVLCLLTIWRFRLTIFNTQNDKDFALFLGITAGMYILLTWLWNPDYGGRKDWDLFAPSAFEYTLLGGYLLVRALTNRQKLQAGGLFIITVSLLHTAAWVFANTHLLPRE